MILRPSHLLQRHSRGFSTVELLIVVAVTGVVCAIALPQLINGQRKFRAAGIPREIMTQLRLARQEAMSQRRAITFQYDDDNKQLVIIQHNLVYAGPDGEFGTDDDTMTGPSVLSDPNYPDTAGNVRIRTVSLTGGGVPRDEIAYGIPEESATDELDDTTTLTPLDDGLVNITFQPDGSVIDADGNPTNNALFLYNSKAPVDTASAISVLGSAGRIKVWRYSSDANEFVE